MAKALAIILDYRFINFNNHNPYILDSLMFRSNNKNNDFIIPPYNSLWHSI